MDLILGSTSERRRELLSHFSLPFKIVAPLFDEESLPFEGDPVLYARTLAEKKAASLSRLYPETPILSADTLVYKGGRLFPKPKSQAEAFSTLATLAGGWHKVYTGVALTYRGELFSEVELTDVELHALTAHQISEYHRHNYCGDKAGAYAIQGGGGLIVKRLEGAYTNVVGLPFNSVQKLLSKVGIDLWDAL